MVKCKQILTFLIHGHKIYLIKSWVLENSSELHDDLYGIRRFLWVLEGSRGFLKVQEISNSVLGMINFRIHNYEKGSKILGV